MRFSRRSCGEVIGVESEPIGSQHSTGGKTDVYSPWLKSAAAGRSCIGRRGGVHLCHAGRALHRLRALHLPSARRSDRPGSLGGTGTDTAWRGRLSAHDDRSVPAKRFVVGEQNHRFDRRLGDGFSPRHAKRLSAPSCAPQLWLGTVLSLSNGFRSSCRVSLDCRRSSDL